MDATSVLPKVPTPGVGDAGLLESLVDVVERLGRQELGGGVDDDALTRSVRVLHRVETMVAAEKLRRIAAVDERAAYQAQGARSTADLLGGLGLTRGEAQSQARTATALGRLPQVAERLAAGEVGVGQAGVAVRALHDLQATAGDGGEVDGAAVGELDRLVAARGVSLDRRELGRTVEEWAHRREPGLLAERERAAFVRRHLWAGKGVNGDLPVEGRLTPVVLAKLGAVLDPLARRTGDSDDRSIGQRRHDALETVLDRAAAVTAHHPDPPPPDPADARDPAEPCDPAGPRDPAVRPGAYGRVDRDGRDAVGAGAGGPGAGRRGSPGPDSTSDARDPADGGGAGGSGRGGAGSVAAEPVGHAFAGGRAQVLLITTAEALHGVPGAAAAELDGVGPVSSDTARQICCDADLTVVTMGPDGAPLDVGRTRRFPTRRQRMAVIARDRRCVGCGAAASRCQVHHVRWRHADGGLTIVANLCLLCPGCHTNVHHFGWTVHRVGAGFRARPPPGRLRCAG